MSYRTWFTDGKGKTVINIDDSELEPSFMMSRGKGFEANYLKHLESLIFNDKEMDFSKIITLIVIMECIADNTKPIKIQCNKYPRLTRRVINVLGTFIDDNYIVLNKLYEYYVGKVK